MRFKKERQEDGHNMLEMPLIDTQEGDESPVPGGEFGVKQTHLGFCPEDVILQIRKTAVVILNDDYQLVVRYAFSNLVMWSQAAAEVTFMLMRNLKRVVFTARNRAQAKTLVRLLTEVTEVAQANLERHEAFWGTSQASAIDAQRIQTLEEMWGLDDSDEEQEDMDEGDFKVFAVRQAHLENFEDPASPGTISRVPQIVWLRIRFEAVELVVKDTGFILQAFAWSEIVLWRSDGETLVLVLSNTNRQVTLLTDAADMVVGYLTQTAYAIRSRHREETVKHKKQSLPVHAFKCRQKLIKFEPQKVVLNDAWNDEGVSKLKAISMAIFGSRSLIESIQTRVQLRAIVSVVEEEGTGVLNIHQLGALMKHLNIHSESGGNMTKDELKAIMVDMEAFNNEVMFDDFVAWTLRTSTGAGAGAVLRVRVAHRKKEVAAFEAIFDKMDQDKDGMLDIADFRLLLKQMGMSLTTREFYSVWLTLDRDRGGDISFEEWFKWLKADSNDVVIKSVQHSIRMTRLLSAAKAAMVYSVDRANTDGKKALRDLFDCMDDDGSEELGMSEFERLVADLRVEASSAEIWDAMQEMDRDLSGTVDFEDMRKWWCSAPSPSASGVLRSKLKQAAFTAKANGPILNAVDTSSEGAGQAETYINGLLSAAFSQKTVLKGKSLGIFGPTHPLRTRCQNTLNNPYTDRFFVFLIFVNVALLAMRAPGQSSGLLVLMNQLISILFTLEIIGRIITDGLYARKTAYLKDNWNVFDVCIMSAVWAVYTAANVIGAEKIPQSIVDSMTMLRSFRAMRFFPHVRNVINAIISGRKMTFGLLVMMTYLISMVYVVGFSLFNGALSSTCSDNNGTCPRELTVMSEYCGDEKFTNCSSSLCASELPKCPGTYECDINVCYQLREHLTSNGREEHIDKIGFDTFGKALVTVAMIVTLDDWHVATVPYRASNILASEFAWPMFALSCLFISLFAVNFFLSGLAYSFIKVRSASRSFDSAKAVKKSFVERALQEDKPSSSGRDRHVLQIINPHFTRTCKKMVANPLFDHLTMGTVVINLGVMMLDHHNKSADVEIAFEMAELVFTCIYVSEFVIKVHALGFGKYFNNILNRLDFIIVLSSVITYVLKILDIMMDGKGTAVLRVLRTLKFVRAARVTRILFRSNAVKGLVQKAFRGMDAVFSLIMFICFILTLSAIVGMNWFHSCYGDGKLEGVMPAYTDFGKSLLVSFQVLTGDGWTTLMLNHMECKGNEASVFFIVLQFTCSFVLCNLFVAIFIENFEIEDEDKRKMQISDYIHKLAAQPSEGHAWVNKVHNGIRGVENLLAEEGKINVLRKRTANEFIGAVNLGAKMTRSVGKAALSLAPAKAQSTMHKIRPSRLIRARDSFKSWLKIGKDSRWDRPMVVGDNFSMAQHKDSTALMWRNGGWLTRQFHRNLQIKVWWKRLIVVGVMLSVILAALAPNVSSMTDGQTSLYYMLEILLFALFLGEAISKSLAYHLFGGPDPEQWPSPTTCYEIALVVVQFLAAFEVAVGMQSFRAMRLIYLIDSFYVMASALLASLAAAWTAILLMFASFLIYGIVGMDLFSGLLWHCADEDDPNEQGLFRSRAECEQAGKEWVNRPFHFDNMAATLNTLFSTWTTAGWTNIWYWTMYIRDPELCPQRNCIDSGPQVDGNLFAPFVYFFTFIMWNSLMLTNLFTSILCDYFARENGTLLMTTEQRNWQFMSLFVSETMANDFAPRPRQGRSLVLRKICYDISHSHCFHLVVYAAIVASAIAMWAQQSTAYSDPTGIVDMWLLVCNEVVLVIFTFEVFVGILGIGIREYVQNRWLESLVVGIMWMIIIQRLLSQLYPGSELVLWFQWVRALDSLRALRLVVIAKKNYTFRKIIYVVKVALPKVIDLTGIMFLLLFMFAIQAQYLCGDIDPSPDATISEFDNFKTVRSSLQVLFQICTGMSMFNINDECRSVHGHGVLAFFAVYFFVSNMMMINLIVALLLDNFDLMGSEDMAVSDMDIELFKRKWHKRSDADGHARTLHTGMPLHQVKEFIMGAGMGTFSMMYEADKFFFNRVLYELGYTAEDVLHDTPTPHGLGDKKIFVPFAELLLALCHIRFSSSCLTLAEEVSKSQGLVVRYQEHAAKMLQVAGRAFCALRRVDVLGRRAPPDKIWSANNQFGAEPRLETYPPKDVARCKVCTLPARLGWCRCHLRAEQTKAEKEAELLKHSKDAKITAKEAEEAKGKHSETKQGFDLSTEHQKELEERQDRGDENEHDVFGLDSSADKKQWDSAVHAARLMCLSSLMSTDRLVPEHVVSQAFDQLQEVVDKNKTTNCLGMIVAYGGQDMYSSDDDDEMFNKLFHATVHSTAAQDTVEATEITLNAADLATELNSIFEMADQEIKAAFYLFDTNKNAIISAVEFKKAVRGLHKSLVHLSASDTTRNADHTTHVHAQVQSLSSQMIDAITQLISADQNYPGGEINYIEFIGSLRTASLSQGLLPAVQEFSDRVVKYWRDNDQQNHGTREGALKDRDDILSTTAMEVESKNSETKTDKKDKDKTQRQQQQQLQGAEQDASGSNTTATFQNPLIEGNAEDQDGVLSTTTMDVKSDKSKSKTDKKGKNKNKNKKKKKNTKQQRQRQDRDDTKTFQSPLTVGEANSDRQDNGNHVFSNPVAAGLTFEIADDDAANAPISPTSMEIETKIPKSKPDRKKPQKKKNNKKKKKEKEQGKQSKRNRRKQGTEGDDEDEDDAGGAGGAEAEPKQQTTKDKRNAGGLFGAVSKLSGVARLKGQEKTARPCYYRVLADEVDISETVELGSEKVGSLTRGAEFSTRRRQVEAGCVRVKCESGWITVMVPSSADTSEVLQLQEIFCDAQYVYIAARTGDFTKDVDEASNKCGFFLTGEIVTANDQVWEPEVRDTIRVKSEKGWASVMIKDEANIWVPQLLLQDPRDKLRWFLRNVTVDKLYMQAGLLECEHSLLDDYHPQTCSEASNLLVELIVEQYFASETTLELIVLPPLWKGAQTGLIKSGDRVEVQNEGRHDASRSKWSHLEGRDERKALNGRKGYVVREVAQSEYEVQLDGLHRSYIVCRANLKHLRFDDTKPKTLFETIATDDLKHFRWLLDEKTTSRYCPIEAIKTQDGKTLESVADRIEGCRNDDGQTLYQAAMAKSAVHIASMLRHHLMFSAVEEDDMDSFVGLLSDGEHAPHLDDGQQGEPHGLDAIRYVGADREPQPLILVAHQKWIESGQPRTLYSASRFGGQCWLEISMRWYDLYGFHYDPDEHTADTFHHLHVKVSADRINGMLATKHVEQLGESDLKTALAWRQKNSFMTRKGTNKGVSGV